MRVTLEQVAKRYHREWILQHLSYTFGPGKAYAITGPNGSGKSTLMQMIAGYVTPTKGRIEFFFSEKKLDSDRLFHHLALCAPYVELIEEFTLLESIRFHRGLKPFIDNLSESHILDILGLAPHRHKQLRQFSSGMQQRVLLGLTLLSDVPLVLLDEPTTNLDAAGMEWYQHLLRQYARSRLLIISSNQPADFDFCQEKLNVMAFKGKQARTSGRSSK